MSQTNPGWLDAREQEAERTVWAKEILAQACGRTVEKLWDSVNATTNKFSVVAEFPIQKIVLPRWGPPQNLPHGIHIQQASSEGDTVSAAEWRQLLQTYAQGGWQIENLEFRHNRFETTTNGQPLRSRFYFSAHLVNSIGPQRAMLEGDLFVGWGEKTDTKELQPVKSIDASNLKLKWRTGAPFFQKIFETTFKPSERSPFIDPLILYDLDGDGLSEILLPAKNLVYHRRQGQYAGEPLCRYPLEFVTTAVVADFDGDGHADLLCATSRGLFLFVGSERGTFDEPPRQVWSADPPLKNAMVLTCGDVDGDGDLDVFLAQYKVPTLGQILRPYYYDANDGWPSFLLLNDGHGNLTDSTTESGLGPKRWRRTYSATLADLDADGHLDLAVVSDFAGLDLYRNDGHGHFTDVSRQWVEETHAFGMALALADFNADGRLDLLMIGMPSPTVERLQALDLWRQYSADDRQRRPQMVFGNRLYLARTNGGFEQTSLNDSIAHSGWSWGCSAFDFDNDGFPDLYLANGLETRQSVREYEPEFWLHNLFIDESVDDVSASRYLMERARLTRGSGWSYGGYEKNRLFLNLGGRSFTDIGHLAGVSLERDSRNVVADDLDGDGKMDLVVTALEVWPEPKQTLQVYQNQLVDPGHWIGFHLHEQGRGRSPIGARVTLHGQGLNTTRQIITGDSHRSQHSATVHFGLGASTNEIEAEIQWTDGKVLKLSKPALDQYQDVRASSDR